MTQTAPSAKKVASLDRLAMLCVAVGISIEALTGFLPLLGGKVIHGYPLMAHMAGGSLFAIGLTVLVILRAASHRLDGGSCCVQNCIGVRGAFWIFVLSGLTLIITPSLAMLPLLGTPGQHLTVQIHLAAAIVALASGAVYLVLSRGGAAAKA